jgi:hypothetical protein
MTVKVIDSTCGTIYTETYTVQSSLDTTGYTCATDNCFCIKITHEPSQSAPYLQFKAIDSLGNAITTTGYFYGTFVQYDSNILFSSTSTSSAKSTINGTEHVFQLKCSNTSSANISFRISKASGSSGDYSCSVVTSTYTIAASNSTTSNITMTFNNMQIIVVANGGTLDTYFIGSYDFGIVEGTFKDTSQAIDSISGNFDNQTSSRFIKNGITLGSKYKASTKHTAYLILDLTNYTLSKTIYGSLTIMGWGDLVESNDLQTVTMASGATYGLVTVSFTTPSSNYTSSSSSFEVTLENI